MCVVCVCCIYVVCVCVNYICFFFVCVWCVHISHRIFFFGGPWLNTIQLNGSKINYLTYRVHDFCVILVLEQIADQHRVPWITLNTFWACGGLSEVISYGICHLCSRSHYSWEPLRCQCSCSMMDEKLRAAHIWVLNTFPITKVSVC